MQQKPVKSSSSPGSVLAVILALMVLDLVVLIVRYFYSNLRCFFQHFLQRQQCQLLPTHQSWVERILDGKCADDVKLSGVEVKLVMESLGIFGNPEGDDRSQEDVGATQVAGLFDDRELSLEEVKEAFDVFDRNCDGFIDAGELCSFLYSFGFLQISEDDCRGMIRAFDVNGDGVIDLREFMKLVEKSLH